MARREKRPVHKVVVMTKEEITCLFLYEIEGISQSSCRHSNWCKIKLLSLEVLFIARRNDSLQKATMRKIMHDYLKNNDMNIVKNFYFTKDNLKFNTNWIEHLSSFIYNKYTLSK